MSKVIRDCCYFSLPHYVIGSENSRHLLNQSDSILKPITTWLHAFSRALGCLRVFALSSRWLIIIFPCYVWLLWWFGIWLYNTQTKRNTRSNSKVTYFASAFIHYSFFIHYFVFPGHWVWTGLIFSWWYQRFFTASSCGIFGSTSG